MLSPSLVKRFVQIMKTNAKHLSIININSDTKEREWKTKKEKLKVCLKIASLIQGG